MGALDEFRYQGTPKLPTDYNNLLTAIEGLSSGSGSVSTQTALAAASAAAPLYLSQAGKSGWFKFDGSNLSSMVTADPQKAVYVAPSTDTTGASGAWVRQDIDWHELSWFGGVPVPTASQGSAAAQVPYDIQPALEAFQTLVIASRTGANSYIQTVNNKLRIPKGFYYCSTFNLISALNVEGDTVSDQAQISFDGTILRGPVDADTFIINRHNTYGTGTVVSRTYGADGSRIANIVFLGANNPTGNNLVGGSPLGSGIWRRARADVENCAFRYQGEHGIKTVAISGSGGATEGNASGSTHRNITATHCGGYGIYNQGADANCIFSYGRNLLAFCRLGGLAEFSFLGGGTHSVWTEECGSYDWSGNNRPAPMKQYLGSFYTCAYGQEVAAETTVPGTDDDIWIPTGGGPGYTATWVSGEDCVGGGAIVTINSTTVTEIFAYSEGSQGAIQIASGTILTGPQGVPVVSNGGIQVAADGGQMTGPKSFAAGAAAIGDPADINTALRLISNGNTLYWRNSPTYDGILADYGTNGAALVISDPSDTSGGGDSLASYRAGAFNFAHIRIARVGKNMVINEPTGHLGGINALSDLNSAILTAGDTFLVRAPAVGAPAAYAVRTGGTYGSGAVVEPFGIVGAVQAAAVAAPAGGGTVDTECRAQLAAVITALKNAKLMAS